MEILIVFIAVLAFMAGGVLIYTQTIAYVNSNEFVLKSRHSNVMMKNYIKMLAIAQNNIYKKSRELENLSRKLNFSNQELERLNDMKSKFLSMVVHDVRNPLAGIKGFSGMMIRSKGAIPEEKQMLYLNNIKISADHLGMLISDLTDLAMIESGKLNIEKKSFNFIEMFEEVLTMISVKANEKNIQIRYKSFPAVSISGDRFRISQVVSNLLGNAVKFTPQNGAIEVFAKDEGGYFYFYVKDFGPGIHPGECKKIFEKFYQSKYQKDPHLKKQGWGLGLCISTEIIRQHKGIIDVVSQGLGKGATFWFKIPKK